MSGLVFFDTNILVYADDASAGEKHVQAVDLFARHRSSNSLVISLQVLQEYYSVATRKLGLPADQAQRRVELLAERNVIRFSARDVIAAIELHRLNPISFWDACIVHAARLANASVLYSEDFHDGAVVAGVRIENPFAVN